ELFTFELLVEGVWLVQTNELMLLYPDDCLWQPYTVSDIVLQARDQKGSDVGNWPKHGALHLEPYL
ncbi:hypothetical protein, partial [Salmonella sp. gx-f7]|uniref:hypothetical protein n=1 Tax=Salmonella sp. gx-f7 TaxID=2582606 RepID=UPI001F3A2323